MVSLEKDGDIFILYIPITFTPDLVAAIHTQLDVVENHEGPTALIITSKNPKIFNAGMDLKHLMKSGPEEGHVVFTHLMKLYGRLLGFSVPTVAAMNGHAVAGGCMLALALDYRVMSKGNYLIKMTEISLGMTLPRGGNIVLTAKLNPNVHRDLLLRARNFTAQEALEKGIVDELVEGDQVMTKAKEIAAEVSKFGEKKEIYKHLKKSMYHEAIEVASKAEIPQDERNAVLDSTAKPKPKL